MRGGIERRICPKQHYHDHQQHRTNLQGHDHPRSTTRRRVEINLRASRNTKYYSHSTAKGVAPLSCTPTMENGLGCPIFLPDNGLWFPRLRSTREGRDGREDIVRQFISAILQCFTNGRVYITTTTTPPTAQNLHSTTRHILRTTQLTCVRADSDLKWRVPDTSVGWDNV